MVKQESFIITSLLGKISEIYTVGPRTAGDNICVRNLCFSNIQMLIAVGHTPQIDCNAVPSNASVMRAWFINGVRQRPTWPAIEVTQPGNYSCTITHACGMRSIEPFFVPHGEHIVSLA